MTVTPAGLLADAEFWGAYFVRHPDFAALFHRLVKQGVDFDNPTDVIALLVQETNDGRRFREFVRRALKEGKRRGRTPAR